MAPHIAEYKERIKNAEPLGAFVNNQWAHLAIAHCGPDRAEAQARAANAMKVFFGPDRPYTQGQGDIYKQLVKGWGGIPDHLENQFKWVLDEELNVGGGEFSVERSGFEEFDPATLCDRGVVIAGDPAACIDGVRRHEEAGEDQVLLLMQLDTIPHEQVMASIRLFAEKVITAFR
jgi:alkanesulfonate monooxygenase SsuD/methylene tetrahydromethanopterin reductase-like flavin-dependent oxidoreductase (luciferase family)